MAGYLRVIVYGYDGLSMQPVAPPSPDYVPGPEHPPSPDYVLDPEHPSSHVDIPYVSGPEYPEYLAPSDDEAPLEDQPLPADASPTVTSLCYVADSDLKEDPEDDHADYPADRGDAPAESSAVPIVDLVLPVGDTEELEADEPTPTPSVGNKMLKAFPLPVMSSHCQKTFPLPVKKAPKDVVDTGSTSEGSAKKKGRTVAVMTKDMQKRRNDVEGKEMLKQTFNRLQAIVSHLEFRNIEIEQDDLNQKLLTSLAPEWLMHTIVWRNISDLDTMSLDDLYNHLKVYEPEVQKKSDSQNMAFISSAKNNSGNGKVNTASIPTTSTQVSPGSANVAAASISLDTACAYIASQSSGSQIKYKDNNQIDEDDIEEMDIKWNMALLSMRAERY
nr:hypothetical protein [Tanacetum cinerariifolium]